MHPSVYKNRYFCVLNSDAISFSLPLHIFFAVVLPLLLIPLLPSLSAKPMTAAMTTTAGGGALPSAGREGGTQRHTRGGGRRRPRSRLMRRRAVAPARPCDGGAARAMWQLCFARWRRSSPAAAWLSRARRALRWWGGHVMARGALAGEARRRGGRPCSGCTLPPFFCSFFNGFLLG